MQFADKTEIKNFIHNKRVVIFGSAPSALDNTEKDIENYDIIIRVNNYDISKFYKNIGKRTDIHYSFYGYSIRKTKKELSEEGIKYHVCKCPDAFCHNEALTEFSKSYRWIYEMRKDFWVAPVYIPAKEDYFKYYNKLNNHVPTTGFMAIMTFKDFFPAELYITGFDFFKSKLHNINQQWNEGKLKNDPICHDPEKEKNLLLEYTKKYNFIKLDNYLKNLYENIE